MIVSMKGGSDLHHLCCFYFPVLLESDTDTHRHTPAHIHTDKCEAVQTRGILPWRKSNIILMAKSLFIQQISFWWFQVLTGTCREWSNRRPNGLTVGDRFSHPHIFLETAKRFNAARLQYPDSIRWTLANCRRKKGKEQNVQFEGYERWQDD